MALQATIYFGLRLNYYFLPSSLYHCYKWQALLIIFINQEKREEKRREDTYKRLKKKVQHMCLLERSKNMKAFIHQMMKIVLYNAIHVHQVVSTSLLLLRKGGRKKKWLWLEMDNEALLTLREKMLQISLLAIVQELKTKWENLPPAKMSFLPFKNIAFFWKNQSWAYWWHDSAKYKLTNSEIT